MMGQDIEYRQPVFDSTARGDVVTEDGLLTIIMHARVEEERAGVPTPRFTHRVHSGSATARLKNGPTGKAPRNFLQVFLCVPAIDAECVQLHQLTRVVFIDAATLSLRLLRA